MQPSLQSVLERAAAVVGRPALLEDSRHQLVGYSSHPDGVDAVREQTILGRRASDEVVEWLRRIGLAESTEPLRVPANELLHMVARWCVPICHGGNTLGYLWFADVDGTLDVSLLDAALRQELVNALTAADAGTADGHGSGREDRVDRALRELLTTEGPVPEAVAQLAGEGLDPGASYYALVLCRRDADGATRPAVSLTLLRAVHQALGALCSHALVIDDHGVVLFAADPALVGRAAGVRRRVSSLLGDHDQPDPYALGLGSASADLADAASTYAQALSAARTAAAFPQLGCVVDWSDLGVYRLISELAAADDTSDYLFPRAAALFEDPDLEPLLETVEVFLDRGCHAQSAADALNLHRTSLYYRIQRFELLAGADLKDGVQRTALHLALKVHKMAASQPTVAFDT